MKKFYTAAAVVGTALLVSACEGDDGANGQDGADGSDGLNAVVRVRDLAVGDADCIGGGTALDSGLDANGNGVLDDAEVTITEFLECAATPTLRAFHASPDAPLVNILVDGDAALAGVDYNTGSGLLPVGQGDNVTDNGVDVNVQVEAITPDGANPIAIDADLELPFGTETTVIATNTVANGLPLAAIVIENPAGVPVTTGFARVQIAHSAPSAPPVDVYVTEPGAALAGSMPAAMALEFSTDTDLSVTPQIEVPADTYQIRVTLAGTETVVYDVEAELTDGADLLIAATDNVFLGESAIQLVILDGTASTFLPDASTPAAAIAVHLSPDAPAVDILADVDSTADDEALKLAENIEFTEFCIIDGVPAPEVDTAYTISVVANADNSVVATQFPFVANKNEAATAIVSGFLSSGDPMITAIPLVSNVRSVATEAQVRITHGSPSTPNVDIYLLPAGTMFDPANTDADFADIPFGADTGILSIDASVTYDVYVTAAGGDTPAIEVPGFAPAAGAVLDIIARDPQTDGSEGPNPQLTIVSYDDTLDDCTTT